MCISTNLHALRSALVSLVTHLSPLSLEPAHKTTTASNSSVHQGATSCPLTKLTENPGEAEVTEFDDLMFGDEDVLGLDVSVDALHRENRENINNWEKNMFYREKQSEADISPWTWCHVV